MLRTALLLAITAALAAALLAPTPSHADRLKEDRGQNYSMTIPDDWTDLPFENQWSKLSIVYGAKRELEKLSGGKKGTGQGGWLHLAISDAPRDQDLDAIAADKEVQGFLMSRFGDSWPEVEIIPADFEEGLPLRVLVAEGETRNLKGKKSPTRAVLLLTVAQGKLYKVRMYAWTTEFDDEGLKADLDLMEMNFDIIDKSEKAPEEQGPPPEMEDPTEEEVIGDEGEVKAFGNRALGWKLIKPEGIASKEWDTTDPAFENVVAWFEGNRPIGSYQVIFYVIRRGRIVNGQQVPDEDLKRWAFDSWWARFHASHPKGEIAWWKWPKKSKTFMVLPDFDDDDARKVIFKKDKKRPIEAKSRDLMKKPFGVAEKIKNQKLGEAKTIEAYRANMEGNRPGVGREIVVRYTWGTSKLTCMLVVSLARDAHKKWEEPINELLRSIEMTKAR